jgi:hypothetical protein
MGRFVKNTRLQNGGSGVILPYGATSLRPTSPISGDIRYNTDTGAIEVYYNSVWNKLTREGYVDMIKDEFTGDSTTTVFGPMSFSVPAGKEARILVYIGNVFQNPSVAFTCNGTTSISFTSPPPLGQTIVILHGYASTIAPL